MPQALIVDDSKTVRVSLKKMLGRFDIDADGVASGEEALEYLRDSVPQLIFMDHMMPGMDGFDTVKAIKANPSTSAIPIVMHTSKGGDIYVGQARALGATDILSKPATEEALQSVLERVERLRKTAAPKSAVSSSTVETRAMTAEMPAVTDRDITGAQAKAETQVMEAQAQPFNPSFSTSTRAITSEIHAPTARTIADYAPLRQLIAVVILVAPVLWILGLYINADREREFLLEREQSLYEITGWGVSQSAHYDFGELPMSGQRLILLRELIGRLSEIHFRGVVKVEGHSGEFCLVREPLADGTVVDMLPSVNAKLNDCAFVGAPTAQVMADSGRQSPAFQDFVTNSPLLQGTGIRIEVIQRGTMQPVVEYPMDTENASASDWNAVALQNNRVEFHLLRDAK